VGTNFFTIAVYPLVRFTLLRTQPADFYFFYSAGGPAYISNAVIDEIDTGERFTSAITWTSVHLRGQVETSMLKYKSGTTQMATFFHKIRELKCLLLLLWVTPFEKPAVEFLQMNIRQWQ